MAPRRHLSEEHLIESMGHRLARLRKMRGLTQADLAAKLGVAQPNVSDYERGVLRLNIELVVSLTRILKVSADELLGLASSPTHPHLTDRRLMQHLALIEKLPRRDKDALMRTIRLYTDRSRSQSDVRADSQV